MFATRTILKKKQVVKDPWFLIVTGAKDQVLSELVINVLNYLRYESGKSCVI